MLNRVSVASGLVINVADLKEALRIYHTDDDATLEALIKAQTARYEDFTGRIMLPTGFEMTLDCWPDEIRFNAAPVSAVTSVKYRDVDDAEQTVDASLYQFVPSERFSRLRFTDSFTSPVLFDRPDPITVAFTAGYQDPLSPVSGLPAWLEDNETDRRNVALLVGRSYDQGMPMPESEMRTIMGHRRLLW